MPGVGKPEQPVVAIGHTVEECHVHLRPSQLRLHGREQLFESYLRRLGGNRVDGRGRQDQGHDERSRKAMGRHVAQHDPDL